MIIDFEISRCHTILTRPNVPFLVTSFSKDFGDNVAPMSAFGFLSYDPPLSLLPIHPSRKTYRYIKEAKECVVNVPTLGILDKVFNAGRKTPPEFDKFKSYGLEKMKSKCVKPVRISQCIAWIEYRLIQELWPERSERPILVLKPVAASVKSEIMDGPRYNPEKAKIPMHLSGNLFSVAEKTILAGDKPMSWKEYHRYISKIQHPG